MTDVLVVGAGPAGSIAALMLAREGVRVRMLERQRFPRSKLCGDTLNPGVVSLLDDLGLLTSITSRALRTAGMKVSGENRLTIEAPYPAGVNGFSIQRSFLDEVLLRHALDAGAVCDEGVTALSPVLNQEGVVGGVRAILPNGKATTIPARLVIATDGSKSRLAFSAGLASHPLRPRRWAIGAYFSDVAGLTAFGEMHIRRKGYIGVAPLPDGLANTCVVVNDRAMLREGPDVVLMRLLRNDVLLRHRFAEARPVTRAKTVGPLAVETRSAGMPGLLLAGDAAGFVDPMTGDGIRFAMRSAQLAALAALDSLEGGSINRAHTHLAAARAELSSKTRFNKILRCLVGSLPMVRSAEHLAAMFPALLRRLVMVAGDVGVERMNDRPTGLLGRRRPVHDR